MRNKEMDFNMPQNDTVPKPETTEPSSDELWNYHNMVQSVEPDHKKHPGTNQTPAKKFKRKKRKARKTQRASRKTNRK